MHQFPVRVGEKIFGVEAEEVGKHSLSYLKIVVESEERRKEGSWESSYLAQLNKEGKKVS